MENYSQVKMPGLGMCERGWKEHCHLFPSSATTMVTVNTLISCSGVDEFTAIRGSDSDLRDSQVTVPELLTKHLTHKPLKR